MRQSQSRRLLTAALVAVAAVFGAVTCARANAGDAPPRPVDAIDAVLAAFGTHRLVALGEQHGSEDQHAFFRALIAEPRFAATVDNIVVEFGNARYQALVDRYVLRGESVPRVSLAWRSTTQRPHAWREPIYPQFFAAVRALNRRLPAARRTRIVLGDPAIDWTKIRTYTCPRRPGPRCLDYWLGRRDVSYANIVRREVLQRGETALLVAGGFHVLRAPDRGNVTGLLEREAPHSLYVVLPYTGTYADDDRVEAELASWPIPSIAELAGTWLGDTEAGVVIRGGVPGARDASAPPFPLEAAADALLKFYPETQ